MLGECHDVEIQQFIRLGHCHYLTIFTFHRAAIADAVEPFDSSRISTRERKGPLQRRYLIAVGFTAEPAPYTNFSGAPANRNVYWPSFAQSSARSLSHTISLKITPRLRSSAQCRIATAPVSV